jgi:hypothetical protein
VEIAGSNPVEGAYMAYVTRYAKCGRATDFKRPWMWVRLPPVLLEHASVGHWQAPLAVNQSSVWTLAVQLRPGALENTARSSNGSGYETLILVIRVRLPYGLLVTAKWRNR